MTDPLAEVVTLLEPRAPYSKFVSGAGRWGVRRSELGQPFYCVLLDGSCRLAVDGRDAVDLKQGDFVLIPAAFHFTMSSLDPPTLAEFGAPPILIADGEYRLGEKERVPTVRMLVGHCIFGSPDAPMLVSLLPELLHIRGDQRLTALVKLIGDEARAKRAARDVVLARLLEVLLIEALRSESGTPSSPGLVRGLADERLAPALRCMHEKPARGWTVGELAKEAALSRSTFFERFSRNLGLSPMEYLLRWRVAVAKRLLCRGQLGIEEVAQAVGYSSGATFSVAFARQVGMSPTRFVREHAEVSERA